MANLLSFTVLIAPASQPFSQLSTISVGTGCISLTQRKAAHTIGSSQDFPEHSVHHHNAFTPGFERSWRWFQGLYAAIKTTLHRYQYLYFTFAPLTYLSRGTVVIVQFEPFISLQGTLLESYYLGSESFRPTWFESETYVKSSTFKILI